MNKEKVITFRCDEDLLAQLDEFASTHTYWSRSYIIVAIIRAFFRFTKADTRFTIVRNAFGSRKDFGITIESNFDETTKK